MQSLHTKEIIEWNLLSNIHGDDHQLYDEETDIWQITLHPMIDEYGTRSCKDPEFWHARQMVLGSYQFCQHNNSIRDKFRRSVREIGEVVIEVASKFYHERLVPIKRKLGAKMLKFHLGGPSLLVVRCFMPWQEKKGYGSLARMKEIRLGRK